MRNMPLFMGIVTLVGSLVVLCFVFIGGALFLQSGGDGGMAVAGMIMIASCLVGFFSVNLLGWGVVLWSLRHRRQPRPLVVEIGPEETPAADDLPNVDIDNPVDDDDVIYLP